MRIEQFYKSKLFLLLLAFTLMNTFPGSTFISNQTSFAFPFKEASCISANDCTLSGQSFITFDGILFHDLKNGTFSKITFQITATEFSNHTGILGDVYTVKEAKITKLSLGKQLLDQNGQPVGGQTFDEFTFNVLIDKINDPKNISIDIIVPTGYSFFKFDLYFFGTFEQLDDGTNQKTKDTLSENATITIPIQTVLPPPPTTSSSSSSTSTSGTTPITTSDYSVLGLIGGLLALVFLTRKRKI